MAGFAAGYVTGWLKDASGSYNLPMFVVGGLMLLSGDPDGRAGPPRIGRRPAAAADAEPQLH